MRNPFCRSQGGGGGGAGFFGRIVRMAVVLSVLSTLFFWLPSKTLSPHRTSTTTAVWKDQQAASSSPNGKVRTRSSNSSSAPEEEIHENDMTDFDEIDKKLELEYEMVGDAAWDESEDHENNHDDDEQVVQDDVDSMAMNQILEKHAVCFHDILQRDNNDGSRTFDCAKTTLDFVPIDNSTSTASLYDHISNFVMKARYNCAPRTRKEWRFLLHPNNSTRSSDNRVVTDTCDLEQLTRDVGGPVGVGRQLLAQQRRMDVDTTEVNSDEETTNDKDDAHVYTVVFLGDSRLRQILESFVGSYSDDITALKVLRHGPPHTAETEDHIYTQYDDLGDILYYTRENLTDIQEQGCHGTDDMEHFYQPANPNTANITMPPNMRGCSDDMSMVEFQHTVRFYFVQRPWSFETLNLAWDKLGLHQPDEQIDAYVLNVYDGQYPYIHNNDDLAAASGYEEQEKASPRITYYPPNPDPNVDEIDTSSSPSRQRPFTKFFWDIPAFHEASIRDLGFWDGATNAGIYNPPDAIHPCMPGLPDDQANLLLFLLLANATHFSCGSMGASGDDYDNDDENINDGADDTQDVR